MRCTIDLDDPATLHVIRVWNALESLGTPVYGRISSSGRGVHLKLHGCEPKEVEQMRMMYDDKKRVNFDDSSTLKPKQILFDEKVGNESGEWTTDLDHLLAEYRRKAPENIRIPR